MGHGRVPARSGHPYRGAGGRGPVPGDELSSLLRRPGWVGDGRVATGRRSGGVLRARPVALPLPVVLLWVSRGGVAVAWGFLFFDGVGQRAHVPSGTVLARVAVGSPIAARTTDGCRRVLRCASAVLPRL